MPTSEKGLFASSVRATPLRRPWIEPIIFMGLLYAIIWFVPSGASRIHPIVVGFLLIAWPVLSCVLHRDGFHDMGIRIDNILPALLVVGRLTLIASLAVFIVGRLFHWPLKFRSGSVTTVVAYLPWAIAQQFVMQAFVYRRLRQSKLSPERVAWATALLFGIGHLPNAVLVVVTIVAGYFWCRMFESLPNVFPLALSQAWMAILIMAQVPDHILHNMRVGPRFWG